MLNTYLIKKALNHHLSVDVPRLEKLYGYYKGDHDILRRPHRENKPNNNLVCSHPSKITDTATAYFLGNPITILDDDIDVQAELNAILKTNCFDDTMLEIAKESSIRGKSGLLMYQDESGETNLIRVPATEVFEVKDKFGKVIYVGRVYSYLEEDEKGLLVDVWGVELYNDTSIIYYKYDGDGLFPDLRYPNAEENHIYNTCPLIIFKNNEEEQGDYEKVLSLIDAYDKLMSDTSNEHEAYRNAYLMLKNLMMTEEAARGLQQGGTIEVGEDGDAKFITKTIQDSAITAHLKKLQDDIHNFTDIPNMSDESFGGNLSGVAIQYKLLGLENKCIIKESKFKKALIQLFKAMNGVIFLKLKKEINIPLLKIQFTRNLPQNLQDIADLINKLDGFVDRETLLTLLPFVENPQLILEKLEEETPVGSFTNPQNTEIITEETVDEE